MKASLSWSDKTSMRRLPLIGLGEIWGWKSTRPIWFLLLQIAKKLCVWLCWRGWWPLTTHWRGPTTDSHGDSWLLSFPPGPVRPSLVNLTPPGSPGGSMLMQALVRTPDQHESVTNRNPLLKPSNRTCLQVAGLQERATAPG